MFTGIVETIGKIIKLTEKEFDRNLVIQSTIMNDKLQIGDSVSVNGVCLTVREKYDNSFLVSAASETLKLTNLSLLNKNSLVNLEGSLTLNKPLGGHLVQGHVASTSRIISQKTEGDSIYLRFIKPVELDNYIVKKGYITIDGMSLTICQEGKDWFEVMLIPHTLLVTIAKEYQLNTVVNIEVDIFARYMEKLYANKH